jgi:hypothetical protein
MFSKIKYLKKMGHDLSKKKTLVTNGFVLNLTPLNKLKGRWPFFPWFLESHGEFVQYLISNNLLGMHKVNSTWNKKLELGTQQVEEGRN